MVTPASISIATSRVTYPGDGPSFCDRIFRETPGVVAGGASSADASVAIKPATAQIAQDATPAKPRRVSMTDLPCDILIGGIRRFIWSNRHFPTPDGARTCLSAIGLASGHSRKPPARNKAHRKP